MTLWGYAVALADTLPLPKAPGVAGDPVHWLEAAGLCLACSRCPDTDPLPPPVDRVMAYARIVDELHQAGTVLPLRYGSTVGSSDELRDLLRRRFREVMMALDQVAGREEWTIRIDRPERMALPPATRLGGLEYLRARQALYAQQEAERQESERLMEVVRAALAGLAERIELDSLASEGTIVLQVLACRSRGEALRQTLAGLPILARLSGPYPPYHYARITP